MAWLRWPLHVMAWLLLLLLRQMLLGWLLLHCRLLLRA